MQLIIFNEKILSQLNDITLKSLQFIPDVQLNIEYIYI